MLQDRWGLFESIVIYMPVSNVRHQGPAWVLMAKLCTKRSRLLQVRGCCQLEVGQMVDLLLTAVDLYCLSTGRLPVRQRSTVSVKAPHTTPLWVDV